MPRVTTSQQLRKMFDLLTISEKHTFSDFLLGDLKDEPWFLKEAPKTSFRKVGAYYVKANQKPRVTFNGKQDYLNRQLYRHFTGENIDNLKLTPIKDRTDYNPSNWKVSENKRLTPISVNTAPKAVDPELQDLVDEIRRRIVRGDENIWEGVEEVFTDLEIAQAKELLNDEI